jgi:hypothetical protein
MSTIHIKAKNKGKFNALKKRTGKSTEALTHSKNPLTRKRAIFAQNARKWHHEEGGYINPQEYGFGGAIQAIAPFLNLIPGVGTPLSLLAEMGGGLLQNSEDNKLDYANSKEVSRKNILNSEEAGQKNVYSKYNPVFSFGGIAQGGNQTPVELEKQEVYETPEGQMGQVNGPSHSEGGVDMSLPAGSFVWSDKLKTPNGNTFADEAARLGKMRSKYEKILNS